jgi:hypothetical protein
MPHPLIEAWREFAPADAPFVLPADRPLLQALEARPGIVVHRSLAEYTASAEFGAENDQRLHLGLLPVPYMGAVETASVYLLMLNPGFAAADYYAEWQEVSYGQALVDNRAGQSSFLCLNPTFAWHPGFTYWHRKLGRVLRRLTSDTGVPYQTVLDTVARRLCVLQLMPYHSPSFGVPRQLLERLPSCRLVRSFVSDVVVPRAREGRAAVVVTRQADLWNVPANCSPVVYSGSAARAAHLTPDSQGGQRMLEILLREIEDAT